MAGPIPATTQPVRLRSSIVAGNRAARGPDLAGLVNSGGHNLIGIWDGPGPFPTPAGLSDLVGSWESPLNARLLPLADNGGQTLTMALLPDSPAVDAGDNVLDVAADPFDQRGEGFARYSGNGADVGAYELQVAGGDIPAILIEKVPSWAVDGLYLSWPAPLIGSQPLSWPLYGKSSLDPSVPWIRVAASQVNWNEVTRRWRYVKPKNSDAEFFRLGPPVGP